jgi:hypothetical protein
MIATVYRRWEPPHGDTSSLLYNGYRVPSPGVMQQCRDIDIPSPIAPRVKNEYSPYGPLYPVLGRTLPLPLPIYISGRISKFKRERFLAHVHPVPPLFFPFLYICPSFLCYKFELKISLSFTWHNFEYRDHIWARTWEPRVFLETAWERETDNECK